MKLITLPDAADGVTVNLASGIAIWRRDLRRRLEDQDRVCWWHYKRARIVPPIEGALVMILSDGKRGGATEPETLSAGDILPLSEWQKWVTVEFRGAATATIELLDDLDEKNEGGAGFPVHRGRH